MAIRSPSGFSQRPGNLPIVGREREQAVLRDRLAATGSGFGSCVLISGTAGLGKTTLVRWLASEVPAGTEVWIGSAYDLTVTPPYGPWLDALARAPQGRSEASPLDDVASLEVVTSQPLLFERMVRHLEQLAAGRQVVLILEDLHWSDPASIELLRCVARHLDHLPMLLMVTYRADELTRETPLFHILPHLVREAGAERLDLLPLPDVDVRAMLRACYQLPSDSEDRLMTWLQARGQGNPFYLTELLRTLEREGVLLPAGDGWRLGPLDRTPLPPIVRQIIEPRLAALDDETRSLLACAAVIGQDIPLDLWRTVSGRSAEAIAATVERASDARIIRERSYSASVEFTHALIRETLYDEIPGTSLRELHRRVAELLARRADPPLSDVASHFGRADDPRAIDWLIRVAERALSLYAARDAIAALNLAHELAARYERNLPADAYRMRARAHALSGAFDDARRDYELTLERGRTAGDRHVEWQALVDLSLLWAERDYERTGSYCRAALDLARSIGEPGLVAHSLNRVANWHVNRDEPELALPLHHEAFAIFEAEGDLDGIVDSLDLLGMASYLNCDMAASTQYYERAIPILRAHDDRQRLAACLAALSLNGGEIECNVATPVHREPVYWTGIGEEGLATAREIDWPAGEALALFALSMTTGGRGDFGRALQHGATALAIAERIEHRQWAIAAGCSLGMLWLALLDLDLARMNLERALSDSRMIGSRFWTNTVASALATLHVETGDLALAEATIEGCIRLDRPAQSTSQRTCWFARATIALARGDAEEAIAIVDRLTTNRPEDRNRNAPALLKLRGDALTSAGDIDAADQIYGEARTQARLFGFRPLLWRIEAARAELYHASGRLNDATAAHQRAEAVINDLAGTIDDASVREPFRQRALARLPASRPARLALLSAREMDVLRLLAEGKADREIADLLYISPRTVMRHVTAILDKLDVPSRTAAAALAIRQGFV